jgi:exonuclease III
MSIVIVTLNMNGMSDNNKRNAIYYWCRKKNIDIVCLQETHGQNSIKMET